MNIMEIINDNPWVLNVIKSIISVVIATILYLIISKFFLNKLESKTHKFFKGNKTNTYVKLLKSINRYIFIIVLIFILLKINGVNISSMVTGVGVIGIVFGFAIQDALKDIIKGFDIITDSYYQVGDVVRIGNYTGRVLVIGIKTTKIEDIFENNIISISNRNIEKVEVLSHMINIEIPLPYELKLSEAEKLMNYITTKIEKLDKVEKVEYRGVNAFADSSIKYQVKVYCEPIYKVQTRRDSLGCILKCLEEKNISIPFNQIDVHQK